MIIFELRLYKQTIRLPSVSNAVIRQCLHLKKKKKKLFDFGALNNASILIEKAVRFTQRTLHIEPNICIFIYLFIFFASPTEFALEIPQVWLHIQPKIKRRLS